MPNTTNAIICLADFNYPKAWKTVVERTNPLVGRKQGTVVVLGHCIGQLLRQQSPAATQRGSPFRRCCNGIHHPFADRAPWFRSPTPKIKYDYFHVDLNPFLNKQTWISGLFGLRCHRGSKPEYPNIMCFWPAANRICFVHAQDICRLIFTSKVRGCFGLSIHPGITRFWGWKHSETKTL